MDERSLLIKKMEKMEILKSPSIKEALFAIDRKDFVLPKYGKYAYSDRPLPIGEDQTISQPSTVVFMLELLTVEKGHCVLDCGSGSGWTTALLSHLVGPKGEVIAMELLHSLKTFGEKNYEKTVYQNAVFIHGNAAKGYPKKAPFDRILISAGASAVPSTLLSQLAIGGKLIIPLRDSRGNLLLLEKLGEDEYRRNYYPGFAFVPFVDNQE